MDSLPPVVHCLVNIPGIALRASWLDSLIEERPFEELARELAQLCDAAERLHPLAREAQVALVAVLARRGDDEYVARLRAYAFERGQPSLVRILRTYRAPIAQEVGDDPKSSARVTGQVALGRRKTLARRPERRYFERLLADPHPDVIRQLLLNTHLTETDVVAIAAHRPGRAAILQILAEFPAWLTRSRVRLAIVYNPATPSHIAIPLLALSTRPELDEIAQSPSLHVVLRATAQELLDRRPPLGPVDTPTLQ